MFAFGLVRPPDAGWVGLWAWALIARCGRYNDQGAYGALGVDSLEDHHAPTSVVTRSLITYIAAGYNQSFAIDHDGRAYSFGANGPWLGHNNLSKSYIWLTSRGTLRHLATLPQRG